MSGRNDVIHSFFFVTRRRQAPMRESSHVRAIASGRRPQRPRQVETAAPRVGFTTYQQAKSLITSSTFSPSSRARPRCDDAAAARLSSSRYCDVCEDVRCVSRRVYTQQRAGLRVHRDRACESRREPDSRAVRCAGIEPDAACGNATCTAVLHELRPRRRTPPDYNAPFCLNKFGTSSRRDVCKLCPSLFRFHKLDRCSIGV